MRALNKHVPELLRLHKGISPFTQQGLEKLNDQMTLHYFHGSTHKGIAALQQVRKIDWNISKKQTAKVWSALTPVQFAKVLGTTNVDALYHNYNQAYISKHVCTCTINNDPLVVCIQTPCTGYRLVLLHRKHPSKVDGNAISMYKWKHSISDLLTLRRYKIVERTI